MASLPAPPSLKNLDLRLILETPLRQFAIWFVMVLAVSLAGYPGVVCVTPLAWLIALRVGLVCAARSNTTASAQRLLEAALAGAFLGLMQGILFIVVIQFVGPVQPDEQKNALMLSAGMLLAGVFAGAVLSAFTAYLYDLRRPAMN